MCVAAMRFSTLMAVAVFFLASCDSSYSDNIKGGYPEVGIDTSTISEEVDTPAALTLGDGLDYQAALVYEVALNWRGYDEVDTTPIEEANIEDCALRGHLLEEVLSDDPESPYLDPGALPISHVESVFCGRTDADVNYYSDGQIYFTDTTTDDCDDAPCPVSYRHYGGFLYPYAMLYEDPAGEPNRTRSRVEIDGTYHDGPGDSIDGGTLSVEEKTQRLTLVNSVETIAAGEVTEKIVTGLIYGDSDGRFVRRDVPATDQLFLDGALASGSDADAACVGGEFTAATNVRMTLDGSNIVAGVVELDNGDGETATLTFQPVTGDVFVMDDLGDTQTFTRGQIETLRNTCFQTVPVSR